MLRFFQSTNAEGTKDYFTKALSRDDYYTQDRVIESRWGGLAAMQMGLETPVEQKAFARLCDNLHPLTGDRLTPRTRDDRTVGYDVSFHAPKGVSLLHALTGDDRIVEAMRQSVAATMAELERSTHTRVRLPDAHGKERSEDRPTANLCWGEFVHFTTRPVDGVPDPHLHVHCFTFNATWDPVEERWKAAQFRPVIRDHPYFQAFYHARLASELEAIGYPVSRHAQGWDLAGIDRRLVTKFSRRTAEIEREAKRLGVTDPGEKAELGAFTRSKKDETMSPAELAEVWQRKLTETEADWLHRISQEPGVRAERGQAGLDLGTAADRQLGDEDRRRVTAAEAIDHALGHIFERKSVESERRVLAEAMVYALDHVGPDDLARELGGRGNVLSREEDGERLLTTREVLQEELAVLNFAIDGRGTCVPLGIGYAGRPGDRYEIGSFTRAQNDGITLNEPQRAAVEHLLSSKDRVMLLRGGAGTGKTALMREAAAAMDHGGANVHAFAVTAEASRTGLVDAGFKNAQTLKTLLNSREQQDKVRGGVIWIDEAGMVGTPTMREVFAIAEEQNARVVLCGDTKQHRPVERGDAMRLIERRGEIRPAEIDEIVRQTGIYKDAVKSIEKGELVKGITLLDEMGAIKEASFFDDPIERPRKLAERYVETVERGKTCVVVSPTHTEGRTVTEQVREKLKANGTLQGEDRTLTRLQDLQWTSAEKADAHNYEVGQWVQFDQHCPGIKARNIAPAPSGSKARIIAVDPNKRMITTEDIAGNRRPLPLDKADRFTVYGTRELGLAVGDRIRFTKHCVTMRDEKGRQHKLTNGSQYAIRGFDRDGNFILDNKGRWKVHRNAGHVTHAYAITPQAAQGKSVDVCLAALSAGSMTASTIEQMYVIVSRGQKELELYTDRRKALIQAMGRVQKELSATDLIEGKVNEPSRVQQRQQHAREVTRLKMLEERRREAARLGRQGKSLSQPGRQQTRQQTRDDRQRRDRRDPPTRTPRGPRGPVKDR